MKRHLAGPLALAMAAALPVVTVGADLVAPAESLVAPSVTDRASPGTTSYGCCWIFLYGHWYCIPCS